MPAAGPCVEITITTPPVPTIPRNTAFTINGWASFSALALSGWVVGANVTSSGVSFSGNAWTMNFPGVANPGSYSVLVRTVVSDNGTNPHSAIDTIPINII